MQKNRLDRVGGIYALVLAEDESEDVVAVELVEEVVEMSIPWQETRWGKSILERKYIVPEGMLKAAIAVVWDGQEMPLAGQRICEKSLEAALRWLSENPIVPTEEQILALAKEVGHMDWTRQTWIHDNVAIIQEWQRRMFLAPEPEVPEEIGDLLDFFTSDNRDEGIGIPCVNQRILEAYRRGQQSKEKP